MANEPPIAEGEQQDFSLVLGDPHYQLLLRASLVRPPRRIAPPPSFGVRPHHMASVCRSVGHRRNLPERPSSTLVRYRRSDVIPAGAAAVDWGGIDHPSPHSHRGPIVYRPATDRVRKRTALQQRDPPGHAAPQFRRRRTSASGGFLGRRLTAMSSVKWDFSRLEKMWCCG